MVFLPTQKLSFSSRFLVKGYVNVLCGFFLSTLLKGKETNINIER
jgi:hypothetical protein